MAKIKLEGVSFVYGKGTAYCKEALKNVNIEIKEGTITGLIGHTGSGKSTMLQLLNGLATPSEGKVYLDGEQIKTYQALGAVIAFNVENSGEHTDILLHALFQS